MSLFDVWAVGLKSCRPLWVWFWQKFIGASHTSFTNLIWQADRLREVCARNISCGLSMWLSFSGKCCSGTALGALLCICWFWSWIKKQDKQEFWPPTRTQCSQPSSAKFSSRMLTNSTSPYCCWIPPKIWAKPLFASFAAFAQACYAELNPLLMSQRALVWHR